MLANDIYELIISIKQMDMKAHRVYIGQETIIELKKETGADLRFGEPKGTIYGIPYFVVNVPEHLDVTMVMP